MGKPFARPLDCIFFTHSISISIRYSHWLTPLFQQNRCLPLLEDMPLLDYFCTYIFYFPFNKYCSLSLSYIYIYVCKCVIHFLMICHLHTQEPKTVSGLVCFKGKLKNIRLLYNLHFLCLQFCLKHSKFFCHDFYVFKFSIYNTWSWM